MCCCCRQDAAAGRQVPDPAVLQRQVRADHGRHGLHGQSADGETAEELSGPRPDSPARAA